MFPPGPRLPVEYAVRGGESRPWLTAVESMTAPQPDRRHAAHARLRQVAEIAFDPISTSMPRPSPSGPSSTTSETSPEVLSRGSKDSPSTRAFEEDAPTLGDSMEHDTVWRMETFEALRERSSTCSKSLGPIELKGVAYPVLLFRAALS